ncbi:MAG: hypothetical protein ABIH23_08280 [bacterium]
MTTAEDFTRFLLTLNEMPEEEWPPTRAWPAMSVPYACKRYKTKRLYGERIEWITIARFWGKPQEFNGMLPEMPEPRVGVGGEPKSVRGEYVDFVRLDQ